MKLWKVTREIDSHIWDETVGAVVRAPDETTARTLVADIGSDEGRDVWFDPATLCEEIKRTGKAEVILSDYLNA